MQVFRYVLLILMLAWQTAHAQTHAISGRIVSESGEALPGVTIMIRGTLTGTVSDLDGNFNLDGVSSKNILLVSYVGFESKEIAVGSQRHFEFVLKEQTSELDEVVVTALGISRQAREIGYSTEMIDSELLIQSRAPNVLDALSGRTSGVQISQGDGVEGGTTRIVIRGNNNIGSDNQPLIVIDNMPLENPPGLTNIGRGVDWGNVINDLNAYDIESMTVLKGGAASALYGSRGANGVLLITTKRGTKRKGIGITYNIEHRINTPYLYRDVQNRYGHGAPVSLSGPSFPTTGDTLEYPGMLNNNNLIIDQDGTISSTSAEFGYYGSAVSWGPKMEGQMVRWWDGEMRPWSPQPDNLKIPYRDGYTTTHNIAATGGGDAGTLRVSITRQDHKPIVENSQFDRTNINLGADINISEKLRADLSVSFIHFNRLNSPMLGEDWNSFNKGLLYSWPRSYKGIDKENYANPDGSQNLQEGYPFAYISPYLWWDYYNNNTTLQRDKYVGTLSLIYDITPWLTAIGRAGRDFNVEQYETRHKPTDVVGLKDGYYANSLSRNIGDNYEFTLNASRESFFHPDFDFRVAGGTNRWTRDFYHINGHSGLWYYPNMYTFFNYTENVYSTDANNRVYVEQFGDSPGSIVPGDTIIRKVNNSVYGILNLSWRNYLFVELTGRNDWSSSLPAGANSYFYPSLSLSFVPTTAFNLHSTLPWLSFMKIRGGIAQTATDTDPYMLDFYYTTGRFGGQQTSGFPQRIPPIQLKPQRVNAYEAGINIDFFDNRIDLDFTYYYLYSFDQIIPNLPVPASSGASSITTNEGILTNKGFEIILNTVPVRRQDMHLRLGFNFARNRNTVVSLGDYTDSYLLADIWGLNGPAMILREGDDFGTISGYDYVYDEHGNRIVNETGTHYLITENRVPIGNASPDFLGGMHMDFSWKGLRLNMLIDTKWGGDIYAGSYVIGLQTGQSPETLKERDGDGLPYTDPDGNTSNIGVILEGVHEDGTPNTTVVHYYYKYMPNAGGWGEFLSTPGIVENTWVKMREISLSYTIPQKIIARSGVFQHLNISLSGRNLFYIYKTLPDNINPEGIMGSGNAQGFEWGAFPGTRSFILALQAGF